MGPMAADVADAEPDAVVAVTTERMV